ncbi:MAG: hypothetical protein ACHWZW_22585 [Spirulina sp.]
MSSQAQTIHTESGLFTPGRDGYGGGDDLNGGLGMGAIADLSI